MTNLFRAFWIARVFIFALMLATSIGCSSSTPPPQSASTPQSAASNFSYLVHVQTSTGEDVVGAEVTIQVTGKAPLDAVTDSKGVARIFVPTSYAGKPGFVIIHAQGYVDHTQNIDVVTGALPDVIKLDKLASVNVSISTPVKTPPPTPFPTAIAVAVSDPTDVPTPTLTSAPTPIASPLPTAGSTSTPTIIPTNTNTPIPTPPDSPTPLPVDTPTNAPNTSPTNMVLIPAGEFWMGSLEDSSSLLGLDRNPESEGDEFPQRTVILPAFWIDKTLVTNSDYRICVDAGGCSPQPGGDANYHNGPAFDDFPVIFVSWGDASTYCEWAGKRLPTEAEWEKAARGTDGRIWPWGNALKDNPTAPVVRANVGDSDAGGNPTPVDAYPNGASPYGVLDMSGNVWEWVNDWYKFDYYTDRPDPDNSPPGPSQNESTGLKVIRGGSFETVGVDARTTERNAVGVGPSFDIGFRCAKPGN